MSEHCQLPDGWVIEKLGNLGSFTNGINKSATDFGFGVPFVNLLDVFGKSTISNYPEGLVNATQSEIERYSLRAGDVIFIRSSVKPSGVGLTALVEQSLHNTVYSGFLIRFRPEPNRFEMTFLRHCFHNEDFRRELVSRSTVSANTNINQVSLRQIETMLPPAHEQRRIAEIISTLDETVEQTETLIAKMQQVKAGLMHDLFTRGVSPDGCLRPTREQAPDLYKESPLGWIPNEWDVSSVELLLDRIIDYRGKTPTKTEEGIPLITAKNVRMGYIDPEPREYISERDYPTWMTRGIPVQTDVVFTTEAPLGNVAQIGTIEKVVFAQRVIILQPLPHIYPNFLKHILMGNLFQRSVFRLSSGTTALGVKQSEFRKVMLAYPFLIAEQRLISDRLDALDIYVARETDNVTKLRQQKHGLMHDLLTGGVRVPLGGNT